MANKTSKDTAACLKSSGGPCVFHAFGRDRYGSLTETVAEKEYGKAG